MRYSLRTSLMVLATIFSTTVASAEMLNWSDWDSSWVSGSLGPQALAISATQTITYVGTTDVGTLFLAGTPDVLIDSPPSFAFNGTGGAADHYLDLYQDGNVPGDGSTHTWSFSSPVAELTLEIWDIDANDNADNYVDQVRITAMLASGSIVAPTSSVITNPSFVQMVAADTWSGIPFVQSDDDTNNGNLWVTFAQSTITSLTIEYINSTDSTTPGQPSGGHAIGIYNFNFIPEPIWSPWTILLFGTFVAARLSGSSDESVRTSVK